MGWKLTKVFHLGANSTFSNVQNKCAKVDVGQVPIPCVFEGRFILWWTARSCWFTWNAGCDGESIVQEFALALTVDPHQ